LRIVADRENTTAELLARYIGERLREDLRTTYKFVPAVLRVEVEETSANRRRMNGWEKPRGEVLRTRGSEYHAPGLPIHLPIVPRKNSIVRFMPSRVPPSGPSQQRAARVMSGRRTFGSFLRQRLELDRGLAAGQLRISLRNRDAHFVGLRGSPAHGTRQKQAIDAIDEIGDEAKAARL